MAFPLLSTIKVCKGGEKKEKYNIIDRNHIFEKTSHQKKHFLKWFSLCAQQQLWIAAAAGLSSSSAAVFTKQG